MAAELAADLAEAAEDGVPQADIIGRDLSDPRSFAASWAAERGYVGSSCKGGTARKAVLSGALAGLAAVAVSGAAVMIVASTSSSGARQALAPRFAGHTAKAVWITGTAASMRAVSPPPLWVEQDTGTSSNTRAVGLVLLIVGLAGVVPLATFAVSRSAKAGARLL